MEANRVLRQTYRQVMPVPRFYLQVSDNQLGVFMKSVTTRSGSSEFRSKFATHAASSSGDDNDLLLYFHHTSPYFGKFDSMASMIMGSVGTVVGRKRKTLRSGVTTNFSKFHRMLPALPRSSLVFVSSA